MDPDSWCTRPSPASRRYHSPSDLFHGGEDVDELRPEFLCPFCAEDFDVVGLCCHVDEEHAVEAKNGPKRRFRKSGSNSTLSIQRKELREGNLQPLLGGSQHLVSSSNTKPDPLLSSFMCNLPVVEPKLVSTLPHSIEEAGLTKESSIEDSSHRNTILCDRNIHQAPLSDKEQEDRARRCEFVKGLLLSTFLDDN